VHNLSKKIPGNQIPKMETLIEQIRAAGYKAARTHFSPISIKTDIPHDKLMKLILNHK
jgi:tRNA G26 N,N-dimethylase Trm1